MKAFTIFVFITVAAVSAQLAVQSTGHENFVTNQSPRYFGQATKAVVLGATSGREAHTLTDRFEPEEDVRRLQNAVNALVASEQTIIDILVHRSEDERRKIDDTFGTMYREKFTSIINSQFSGDFRDASLALMTALPIFNAQLVHKMFHWIYGDIVTVIEVVVPLNNNDIKTLLATYATLFRDDLPTDVRHYVTSDCRYLLPYILAANRTEDTNVDEGAAKKDAESLFQASDSQPKGNRTVFNRILTSRSYAQLRRIFDQYENISGHSLEKTIATKFSVAAKEGLLALVKVARNKTVYFAERLRVALAKRGINSPSLVRLIMSRAEVGIAEIKEAYEKMYGTSLVEDIKIKTSGGYRRLLLTLIDDPTFL